MIDWGVGKCTEALGNCPVGLLLAHMARSSKSGVQDCNREIHGLVSEKPQLGSLFVSKPQIVNFPRLGIVEDFV